jgi:hypothetical protein
MNKNNTQINKYNNQINKNNNQINNYNNQINNHNEESEHHELYININQSIVLAQEYLLTNRAIGLLNNVIKINGQNIDMFDHLIINDNFNTGEFALVASSGQDDLWFARKTHNNLVQYYHVVSAYDLSIDYIFNLFIKGYHQRLTF